MSMSVADFRSALRNRDLEQMERYLREGGDPNAECSKEEVPIVETLKMGFSEGTALLLSSPFLDVNRVGTKRVAPLHMAACTGNVEAIRVIISQKGGRVNILGKEKLTPLHFATYTDQAAAIEAIVETSKAVGAILGINARTETGITPLMYACILGKQTAAQSLIRYGARLDERCDLGYTAKAYSVFCGNEAMSTSLPADPYTEEFIHRKVVAHFLGVDGSSRIGNMTFPLSGACAPLMHRKTAETLEAHFRQFPYDDSAQLVKAFRSAPSVATQSPAEVVEYVKNHNLTLLPTGWSLHAIDILLYGSYMVICNRGAGVPAGCSTLEAFKINRDLFNEKIVDQIGSHCEEDKESASQFYYVHLPKMLSTGDTLVQDDWCALLKTIAPKQQKRGTCALASAKAALRAAWFFLEVDRILPRLGHAEVAERVRRETKKWSLLARGKILEDYFYLHFTPSTATTPATPHTTAYDAHLIARCQNALERKVAKVRGSLM